jgi:hypothetical protein
MESSPYRALAAAVLMRAIKDAYGQAPKGVREEARRFLRPHNAVLVDYCEGLDLDPEAFCAAVHENGPQWCRSTGIKRSLEGV